MYEKLDKCPSCGSEKIVNHFICKDFVASGESFALSNCQHCSLTFTNPRPVREIIDKYYPVENYTPHSRNRNLFTFLYRGVRFFNNRYKLRIIDKISPKGRIIDIGCGTGNFLSICKSNGWEIAGVEPIAGANIIASNLLSIPVQTNISDIPDDNLFDVITFWHVLEHIYELHESIDNAKRLLKRNGKIVIALPNCSSYDAGIYKEFWSAFDVPRHLYHFNPISFSNLSRDHGLKLVETLPLYFDAYYISLLSDQYMNGHKSWIKSFINGYKSNSYAKINHNNYSSLIYILKK